MRSRNGLPHKAEKGGWMKRIIMMGAILVGIAAITAGCLPTQTIIVKFDDLKSDLFAVEKGLQDGAWYKIETDKDGNMVIRLLSKNVSREPSALGSFQIAEAGTTGSQTAPAAADNIDLKSLQYTDTFRQILMRRQNRYDHIVELKKSEVIGESNNGLIALAPNKSSSDLSEESKKLVKDENTDRILMFEEILRQKSLSRDKIDQIAKLFAEVQYSLAAPGMWVQNKDGVWEKASKR